MAGYKIFYFKCSQHSIYLAEKGWHTSCLTLTYNITQDMKIAGILQNGPWKDVCAQSCYLPPVTPSLFPDWPSYNTPRVKGDLIHIPVYSSLSFIDFQATLGLHLCCSWEPLRARNKENHIWHETASTRLAWRKRVRKRTLPCSFP